MDSVGNEGSKIEGVRIFPLRQIPNERGDVLSMVRADWPHFEGFGEIYFSEVLPGAVKAWKRHRLMTQNITTPVGRVRLVIFDDRPGSATCGVFEEIVIGRPDHYSLIRIPPGIWYGFQGLAETTSLLANMTDIPHDPTEAETRSPTEQIVPYIWR
jgi:dTDP-4-dehydrorhamnose 3,5-epimerase